MHHVRMLVLAFCVLLIGSTVTAANKPATPPFAEHELVTAFIDDMVERHHFDRDTLTELFDQIEFDEVVIQKISKPFETKPWDDYKAYFITPERIEKGVAYLNAHQDTLKEAAKTYGIPPEIMVAIIGVETDYGNLQGTFPVFQTLSTLAFDYPSRAAFFKKELEQFLLLTREYHLDPLKVTGSYAGAIGLPQFMPSSYRNYAASLVGNKSIDLNHNDDDAIASVGNYLSKNGWKRQGEVAVPADIKGMAYQKVLKDKFNPDILSSKLSSLGIQPKTKIPAEEAKAVLVELTRHDGNEYWLGFHNYYVLSTYNHNKQYVLTVFELSKEISKQAKLTQQKSTSPAA